MSQNPQSGLDVDALFGDHLNTMLQRCETALARSGHDALIIEAGQPPMHFLDDQPVDFRCNPHFRALAPLEDPAGSALLIRPGQAPVLLQLLADDYWHLPPAPASGAWTEGFDLRPQADADALARQLDDATGGARVARITPWQPLDAAGPNDCDVNPSTLLAALHHGRAVKTPYEQACMAGASARAAAGHQAARDAFHAGASEYAIHLAYLQASGHLDADLPYGSIVALGRHAAVLHYQHRDRQPPSPAAPSFLIDAGASWRGYGADVTRTHAAGGEDDFAALIRSMDALQRSLVDGVRAGVDFVDLHQQAHALLAEVLLESGLARGSSEALLELGVTRAFLPHGLGHLIGIQTHDVGGFQQDPEGHDRPAPDADPALRLTRHLEPGFVVTIEPGLYFIPMLLDGLRAGAAAELVDFRRVDALMHCGGIRIEDNVLVTADAPVNLTRDAFDRLEVAG